MSRTIASGRRSCLRAHMLAVGVLALALAGCVDTLPQVQASAPELAAARLQPKPGVSPAAATVAFVNLGGAPASVGQKFAGAMSQALGARAITSEAQDKAHYLIRGHMSASAVDGGTALAYVWDIYDNKRRRLQRLEDEIVVKGASADPWAAADDKALASLAGRSADEIAAFLTHTPEAVAAAGSAPAASSPANAAAAVRPRQSAQTAGGSAPLGYAPLN